MSDFNHFLTEVLADEDKPLLSEAVACANAKAFRAAYVMTWLCCAESLKRRFELAAIRDGKAGGIVGEWKKKESECKSIDLFLLTKACEYGFVTNADFLRLRHVYEKRCVFGHPYETAPMITEVVDAMSVATAALLSKPVTMKHGYLDSQGDAVTNAKSFLDDYEPSVKDYATDLVSRAAPELLGWWLSTLCKKTHGYLGDPSMSWAVRRVCWIGDVVLPQLDPSMIKNAFADVLSSHPFIASFCLARTTAFSHLSPLAADQVVSNLLERSAISPAWLVPLFQQRRNGALTPRQELRLSEFLKAASIDSLAQAKVPLSDYIERVIAQLKVRDWNVQNPTAESLMNVSDSEFGSLDPACQEQLGRNLLQAAQKAHGCDNFIAEAANGGKTLPSRMLFGMLAELFVNDAGQIRPKLGSISNVLRAFGRLSPEIQTPLIDELIAGVSQHRHKDLMFTPFRNVVSAVGLVLSGCGITEDNQQKLCIALKAAEQDANAQYTVIYGRPMLN